MPAILLLSNKIYPTCVVCDLSVLNADWLLYVNSLLRASTLLKNTRILVLVKSIGYFSTNFNSVPVLVNVSVSGKLSNSKFGVILSNFCFTESVLTFLLLRTTVTFGRIPSCACVPTMLIVGVLV